MSAEQPQKNPEQQVPENEQDLELAARIAKRVTGESDRFRALIGKLPDRRDRDHGVEL